MAPNQYQTTITDLSTNDDGTRANPPRLLVVHTYEDDGSWSAEAMADYQSGRLPHQRTGSYTIVVDGSGRSCRENDDEFIPWAAGWTANRIGLHASLSGRAAYSREQWLRRTAQLEELSRWLAHTSRQYGIPLSRINGRDVAAGARGVCGHVDISAAFAGETDHTDPGANFPFDTVLERARHLAGGELEHECDTHLVTAGETLSAIARRYRVTVGQLVLWNDIQNRNLIKVGQALRVKQP